jgi:hypothetical protein
MTPYQKNQNDPSDLGWKLVAQNVKYLDSAKRTVEVPINEEDEFIASKGRKPKTVNKPNQKELEEMPFA